MTLFTAHMDEIIPHDARQRVAHRGRTGTTTRRTTIGCLVVAFDDGSSGMCVPDQLVFLDVPPLRLAGPPVLRVMQGGRV